MRNPGERQRLEHILEQGNHIQSFLEGKTFDDILSDLMLRMAIERCLSIIGEAANHLSTELTDRYPQIPWRAVVNFRNFIIHEYFGIDHEGMWNTIQDRLPELLQATSLMLAEYPLQNPEL